jgi:hypothetical protein
LELIQGLGEQGIVGSICPKNTSDDTKGDFGYRPAIATLIARLREKLRDRCLPRSLDLQTDGSVSCVILEVFDPPSGEGCKCEGQGALPGRGTPAHDVLDAYPNLDQYGSCACEILQLKGDARAACSNEVTPPPDLNGFCYVDPSQSGNREQCQLVKTCEPTKKRIIRYVGEQPRGTNIILCQEQAFAGGDAARGGICN